MVPPVPARPRVREFEASYGQLSQAFIENEGQVDGRARLYVRSGRQTLWLTNDGVVFDLLRTMEPRRGRSPPEERHSGQRSAARERLVFTQKFLDPNRGVTIEPGRLLPGVHNYYTGNDPSRWRRGVRRWGEVVYRDIWTGIDLRLHGDGPDLEQEFVVRPGGDASRIRVEYQGIEGLRVAKNGALVVRTAFGELTESPPTIYQEIDGKRIAVTGRFKLLGSTAYTFELGPYEPRYAVVIDPTLVYASYLGGSLDDNALGIAVDGDGHAYLAGSTQSTNFPLQNGLYSYSGGWDVFVTRLNRAGTALTFSTYLGGSGDDTGPSIAVDTVGAAYVVGSTTSTDFPTLNALQPSSGGQSDAFVVRIDPSGLLGYSTYLGGAGNETGVGIAVDPSCNTTSPCAVYVSGTTSAAFLPAGGAQPLFGGVRDAFVVRVGPTGSTLQASTYIGGSGAEDAGVLALGADGSVYMTGQTSSLNFPTSLNALQSTLKGPADAFVVKLSADLSTRLYATYFGGTGTDGGNQIVVDSAGAMYVGGHTNSPDLGVVNAVQGSLGGSFDGFVLKLDPTGSTVLYLTYLGGSGSDDVFSIALDDMGSAYVTGITAGGLPTNLALDTSPQPTIGSGGGTGAYVAKLSPAGNQLLYLTYLGGASNEVQGMVAVDAAGSAYVALGTFSSGLPSGFLAPAGGQDAYVVKLGTRSADLSVTKVGNPSPVLSGNNLTYTISIHNAGPDPAINARMLDTVPVGTTFQSVTPSTGCSTPAVNTAGAIDCALGTLASGATVTLFLVVKVTAVSGSVSNTVAVRTITPDPNPANDAATANTTVTAAGAISGTVCNGAQPPCVVGINPLIAGATVVVRNSDSGTEVASGTTDSGGNYTIGGLPPRNYTVSAEANGFAVRYFSNQVSLTAANVVTVGGGATTTNINFGLPGNAGSIAGKVTLIDGVTPVANAAISIRTPAGDGVLSTASTNASGDYSTLRRLAAGNYIVRVTATGFPVTYYTAATSVATARQVVVTPNGDTTGINVRLSSAVGGISGTVTSAATGAPLAGVGVSVYEGATGGLVQGYVTDNAGRYNTGQSLAPGQYKVTANVAGSETLAYNNKFSVATGDPVTVSAGQTSIGIDLALPLLGAIIGHVRNVADNSAIQGAIVDVYDYAANTFITSTTTAADGSYTVSNLNPLQAYRARARLTNFGLVFFNNQPSAGTADVVTVPAGSNATVDFALGTGGGITGTVTDAVTGQPIQGVLVDVVDGTSTNFSINDFVNFAPTTNASGVFNTGPVLAPGVYKLRARKLNSGYIQTFYPSGFDLSTAATVTVTAANTVNVNIAMQPGGTITGTIRDRVTNSPISGASVAIQRVASSTFFGDFTATTDASGNYTITGLHPGEWLISAQATGHMLAWYSGDPNNPATDFSSSLPTQITGTSVVNNVSLSLQLGGAEIRGRVTRSDTGQPVTVGTGVTIRGPWPRTTTITQIRSLTNEQGDYSFSGLGPGRYIIEADRVLQPNGTAIGFFPFGSISRNSAVPVTVTDGAVVTADFQVTAFAGNAIPRSIRGTLKDSSNNPIRNAFVFAAEPTGTGSVRFVGAFDDGSFTVDGLAPGRYVIGTQTEKTFAWLSYPSELTLNTSSLVDVTAGDATGINLVLPGNAGTITGTITRGDTGQPVLGASIAVRTFTDSGVTVGAASRVDGTYLVRGVTPGAYKVRVSAPGFVTKFFKGGAPGGVLTSEDGSFVAVTSGTETQNINVVLDPTGGALTGTVRREDTLQPVVATVAVIHDAATGNRVMTVSTDANGTWLTEGLGPGTYKVGILDVQAARHATRWYGAETTLLSADPVTVASIGTTGGIDVLVSANRGSISGQVSRSDATPLANAVVTFLDSATGGLVRRALVGSTGAYTAEGLTPGSDLYVAQARALGFADKYFADVPSKAAATSLTVASGNVSTGRNFLLTASADITGSVSYSGSQTGALIVRLFSDDAYTQQVYETVIPSPSFAGPGQAYSFALPPPDTRGLVPGTYYVKAFLDSNGNGFPDATEAVGTLGGQVILVEGQTASGVNLSLSDPAATTNTPPTAYPQEVIFVQGTSNNLITLQGLDAQTAASNLKYTATNPAHGTLASTPNAPERLYTPNPSFAGTDSFTFTVTDRGNPDNCGAPGPTCAAPLTSAPATVTIQVTPSAGVTSTGPAPAAGPAITAPPDGSTTAQPIGNVEISENAPGALIAGSAIKLSLPTGLTFASLPTVSFRVANGAVLNTPTLESKPGDPPGTLNVVSFTLATASTGGKATILVSSMAVLVAPGFFQGGVTSADVLVTIFGPNPGLQGQAVSIKSAVAVAPAAGPALSTVAPARGAQGAVGRIVTLTGANFANDATVSFGPGVSAAVTIDNATQITATLTIAGNAALGVRDVMVTNVGAGQSVTKVGAFQITAAPAVASATGPNTDGSLSVNLPNQLVTITGSNFQSPTTTPSDLLVSVGGAGLTVVEIGYTSQTTMTAVVSVDASAALTAYNVTVTNPDGGSATGVGIISVAAATGGSAPPAKSGGTAPPPPPSITSLTPNAGALGRSVGITGSGFSATASSNSVTFAGAGGTRVSATVTAATTTQLTVTVPTQATAGNVTVAVGGVLSNGVSFSVTNPVLTAVLPTSGTQGSPASLTLSGLRFAPGASVGFGGALGDIVTVSSPTVAPDGTSLQMNVSVAALATLGAHDVTVTNPDGTSSTLAGAFQVKAPIVAGFIVTLPAYPDPATYLPGVGGVSVTRDATGLCTAKTVTPTAVQVQAQFATTDPTLTAPSSVTFSITSSAIAGTASNETCEVAPYSAASPSPDWSIGAASPGSQSVVVQGSGGIYTTTLYSYDWGGKVTITVTGVTGSSAATGTLALPVDADGDDLPDAYEKNTALNADQNGVNVLNFQNPDQNGNGVKDRDDRFAKDGLTNFEKYRGVYLVGPAVGQSGAMGSFQRLGAGSRHLFVRGRGFRDDPAVPAGFCGINPSTGAPVADPSFCPAFQVGPAFQNIGVSVHNVSSSFTATTELPRTSYASPTTPTLDMVTVIYDGVNCKGTEACDTISKFGVRQWGFTTLGYTTPYGTVSAYGVTTLYKRAINSYFNARPYQHRTNDPTRVVSAPDGTPMLAPITLVGDSAGTGADNGLIDVGDATVNGQLAGDAYISGSFTQQLTAMDANNDGCVELPTVADPTTIGRCTPTADTAASPSASRQQVGRSVITHEVGHAVGISTHTSDSTDIMYMSTINFTRDGHFSDTAAALVQIHNKGIQ